MERNALAANLVDRAQAWPWNSLGKRQSQARCEWLLKGAWPKRRPANWVEMVNMPMSAKEHERIEQSVKRGFPLGEDDWVRHTAEQLSLQSTLRPRGGQPKAQP